MRRRRPLDEQRPQFPAELLRFDPVDWPTGCHPTCAWWDAFWAWVDVHPGEDAPEPPEGRPDVHFHPETI